VGEVQLVVWNICARPVVAFLNANSNGKTRLFIMIHLLILKIVIL
jgi:hypothetical protein